MKHCIAWKHGNKQIKWDFNGTKVYARQAAFYLRLQKGFCTQELCSLKLCACLSHQKTLHLSMWSAVSSTGLHGTEILEQVLINSPQYAVLILNTKMKIGCHTLSRALVEEAIQLLQDWSQKLEEKQPKSVKTQVFEFSNYIEKSSQLCWLQHPFSLVQETTLSSV